METSSNDTEQTPQARLSFRRVSDDGRTLLLSDGDGAEYVLEVTSALRTALQGGTSRRSENQMTSTLRPREIQTRIRSGESPEAVADAAGTTVEAIMPYVAPVIAEREHIAARAQRSSLRRAPGEPANGPAQSRVLGDAVAAHLRAAGGDPEAVEWDAFRGDTGRWVLTATYTSPARSGTARFTFDAPGNYSLVDGDDARWLVGEVVEAAEAPRDDLQQARRRRLSVAGDNDELPLGDDALDLVSGPTGAAVAEEPELTFDEPLRPTAPPAASEPAAEAEPEPEPSPARRAVQKKRGRASVPSWDEIMFGGSSDG